MHNELNVIVLEVYSSVEQKRIQFKAQTDEYIFFNIMECVPWNFELSSCCTIYFDWNEYKCYTAVAEYA